MGGVTNVFAGGNAASDYTRMEGATTRMEGHGSGLNSRAAAGSPQPDTTDYRQVAKLPGAPAEPPPPAILTSAEWGVLVPFRWVEVEGWPGDLHLAQVTRRSA